MNWTFLSLWLSITRVFSVPSAKHADRAGELICTVGSFAMTENMYPPDGLCNYLFYTHVFVYNSSLAGIHVEESWQRFKEQVASRTATPAGISFDARYITAQALDEIGVRNTLNTLAKQNIMHYGILNMITRLDALDDYMDRAKGAIAKLRTIQGKDAKKRIIIALGLFDYNEPNAWERYRASFRKAVEGTMADTIIAISSTGSIEDNSFCHVAPTSVLDSMKLQDPARTRAKSFPDLDCKGDGTQMSLLSGGVKLGTSTTEPAWLMSWDDEQSLTEKVQWMRLDETLGSDHYIVHLVIQRYKTPLITGQAKITDWTAVRKHDVPDVQDIEEWTKQFLDMVAKHTKTVKLNVDHPEIDGLQSSIDLRPGLSWLLFNVHLGDFSGQCMADPFERVMFLKNRLGP
ncbi:hypothetical protein HPB50_011817 [Hyalomma asiaticum]|uniref:Uncharacterized protein n=1 Tax=Hyalomma asiaticum TaxID=266040 RepID=A0ACB7RVR7_HYAAI|nr:hypothetical protein HPB50_011817 [Hyalomma asiaticum]